MLKKIPSDELELLRMRSVKYSNLANKLSEVSKYLRDNRNIFGEVTLPPYIVDRMIQVFLHHINFDLFYNSQNSQTYGKTKTLRQKN